jgi:hypothetical protein
VTLADLLAEAEAGASLPVRTARQVAELLELDVDVITAAVDDGSLVGWQLGRRTVFSPPDVLRFAVERRWPDPRLTQMAAEIIDLRARLQTAQESAAAARAVRYAKVLPAATKRAVVERDGRQCRYCGRRISRREPLHIDHVIARSLGGGDDLDNLVVACIGCNTRKGALRLEQCGMMLRPVPVS